MKVHPTPGTYENPAAESLLDHLKQVHTKLRLTLERAQERYKQNFDRKANPAPPFAVGDLVWLNRKNIETVRPSKKLDSKWFGPFKIVKVVGEGKMAFELELPPQWRIHPVFHASLLDPYQANRIDGRKQLVPEPPEIVEGEAEYEVEEILDSKIVRKKLLYYVDWKGYGPEERTWEPAENLTHTEEAIAAYHLRHPERLSAADPTRAPKPRRSSDGKRGGTVTNIATFVTEPQPESESETPESGTPESDGPPLVPNHI